MDPINNQRRWKVSKSGGASSLETLKMGKYSLIFAMSSAENWWGGGPPLPLLPLLHL